MKPHLYIWIFLFLPLSLFAQLSSLNFNFSYIDQQVKTIHTSDKIQLAQKLSALGKTDMEKTRAIFRWITEHIEYNMIYYRRNKEQESVKFEFEAPDDPATPLPSLDERIADKVLQRKTAFCDGYSRLFKFLCDATGIRSVIIKGYARNGNGSPLKHFAVNHTWNAVAIENKWYLLDVTWASGFVSYNNEFIRQYNNFYFFTPPELFINDHYPEDLEWTLLTNPPLITEFKKSPLRYAAFNKAGILSYSPEAGIMDASAGDTLKFYLNTRAQTGYFYVSEKPVADTTGLLISYTSGNDSEKKCILYFVPQHAGEWLYLFYNDEIILRYKVNFKRENSTDKKPTI